MSGPVIPGLDEILREIRGDVAAIVAQEKASVRLTEAQFQLWLPSWNLANLVDVLDRRLSAGEPPPTAWRKP